MTNENIKIDRRNVLKYAGAVGTVGLLAGCIGNQKQGENTTTDGGNEQGDTSFTYVTTLTPGSLDPMKGSDNLETIFTHNLYDPLLYYSNSTPPKLKSWLAKDWSVADDDRTYTLNLQENATFHNGDSVTAEDVKYSVQRMHDIKQGFSWMWSDILKPQNVTAVDETTVEMKTSKVFAPFPYTLPFLFVVNKNQIQQHAKDSGKFGTNGDYATSWLENNDAGSGPYKLTNRKRKQQVVLKKNSDWWGSFADGNVYETVTTEMVEEAATVAGKVKDGSADMSDRWLSLKQYSSLGNVDGVTVHAKATFNPLYIFMHNQREPLSDKNVRKAISYALDYNAVLNDVMSGESDHLVGPLPDAMWGHTADLPKYKHNFETARKHLDKSNFSAGDIDLTYTYVTGLSVEKNVGLLLQKNLDKIGINLEIQKAPWSKITSMASKKSSTPDMLAIYLSFSYVDPDTFLYPAWHSNSHGSWTSASWYENKKVDQLLTKGRQTTGKKNRIPIYKNAQRLIAEDAPALFVMNKATRNALKKDVQGFNDNGIAGYRQTYHWFTKS
ncbi:ABC transporter substrate-binding protein [Halocatena marina]|uniref:ABC transporter substrate-binding protein n=1 Tax=Halocatena marina TaxID=2934937 RepID=UPI00200E3FB0|nr:ABC transporter substrate-binding protein [Halocatena marina]